MPLINGGINLILTWSANCVITDSTGAGTFTITYQNFASLSKLCQLKIIQNYCKKWNQDSNTKLTGININQEY